MRGQGQALSSISASEGVIISHPGVTGAKTVIWKEGSRGKTWRSRMLQRSGESDKKEDTEKGSSNHVYVTEPRSRQSSCKIY